MKEFELLHPAIQHHVVNSLGWRDLRPFQKEVIPTILAGHHHVILAPTAGGKTESALFPLLSRMATEEWTGTSILYVCPLRALLNNLTDRVVQYTGYVGATAGVWHGDVTASQKSAMLKHPPSVLLTTPESLEGILISANKDHVQFLGGVKAVVVDEIHAFAGDDRGWHLLFLLNRLVEIAQCEYQRIGLSATVGNPSDLMDWLTIDCHAPKRAYMPVEGQIRGEADVTLDFVGNLDNAAEVISRLHRGEKRLVFIDSRSKAEELGAKLRNLRVDTFVTHGSLSREQRMISEQAFAERHNCVIVATSVLELGIDIGSLDRVIQIDAPPSVAGFLQRMGRTGRRYNTTRNCLFLATERAALAQAAALLELWNAGYVEPAIPPVCPLHIAAQQILALPLQERGCAKIDILRHLEAVLAYAHVTASTVFEILEWMLKEELVWDEEGLISVGKKGDDEFARRHFFDLVSVFCTPPLFTIRHGRQDVGFVDKATFTTQKKTPCYIQLAGRTWKVNQIEWDRRIAYVEPTQAEGKTRWLGLGPNMSFELCQAYQQIICSDFVRPWWSRRAKDEVQSLRLEHAWLSSEKTTVTLGPLNRVEWWTFAGTCGNATLAAAMREFAGLDLISDPFTIACEQGTSIEEFEAAILDLKQQDIRHIKPMVSENAIKGLKFRQCLPEYLARRVLEERLLDVNAANTIMNAPFAVSPINSSTN